MSMWPKKLALRLGTSRAQVELPRCFRGTVALHCESGVPQGVFRYCIKARSLAAIRSKLDAHIRGTKRFHEKRNIG